MKKYKHFIGLVFLGSWLLVSIGGCAMLRSRYHEISQGDTLWSISREYGIGVAALKEANPNLKSRALRVGAKVYLPFETTEEWKRQYSFSEYRKASYSRGPSAYEDPSDSTFVWPLKGVLSSGFGWRRGRRHHGIDIAAPKGKPIRAARGGHVVYAGSGISGYGNLIVIRHMGSYATVYGHLSKIQVERGQFVPKGEVIGLVGSTGHSTNPHLHFEIREGRLPVDPLLYLR